MLTCPKNLELSGMITKSKHTHAEIAHLITGLAFDHVQFAGIHCKVEGSLNRLFPSSFLVPPSAPLLEVDKFEASSSGVVPFVVPAASCKSPKGSSSSPIRGS